MLDKKVALCNVVTAMEKVKWESEKILLINLPTMMNLNTCMLARIKLYQLIFHMNYILWIMDNTSRKFYEK